MQSGLLQGSSYIHIRQDGHLVNRIRAKHLHKIRSMRFITVSPNMLVRALTLLK